MSRTRVLVVQSHRSPLPAQWYQRCIDSVRAWAMHHQFEYRWMGDELLRLLPATLLEKTMEMTARQPVVATDLARLHALGNALDEGFDTAVWVDADTLVLRPASQITCISEVAE